MKKTIGLKSEGCKGLNVLILFISCFAIVIISLIPNRVSPLSGLIFSLIVFSSPITFAMINLISHHKLPESLIQTDDHYLYLNYASYTTRIELNKINYVTPTTKHLLHRFAKIRVYTENQEYAMKHVDHIEEVVRRIMEKVVTSRTN